MKKIRTIIEGLYEYAKRILKKALPGSVIKALKDFVKYCAYYPVVHYSLSGKTPLPRSVVIDVGNVCNLHCPLCPTGAGMSRYEKTLMPLATFKAVLGKMPWVRHVSLFNWGEPFLNPDIFAIIRYARERAVEVNVHTNFSFKKGDDFFVDIVECGLNILTVSLDGASQETYEKYRVGGDFGLVIANIESLERIKRQHRRKAPVIVWKFIVNKFNEHEIPRAKEMAARLGVTLELANMGLGDDLPDVTFACDIETRKKTWLPSQARYINKWYQGAHRYPLYNAPCDQLFNWIVIAPDGNVFPCCLASDKNNTFGNILKSSFKEIWNNETYAYSRSLFAGRKYCGSVKETICTHCRNFKKKHARSYCCDKDML